MKAFALALVSYLIAIPVFAFEIPKGLTESDRREVVRTLGLNSASKALDNPYPLGGYSGFEIGFSVEFVNVRDLRKLGCAPGSPGCANTGYSNETEWRYSRVTIGKGLYNDVDVFFSFMPPTGGVNASDYGGQIRWSFYQAKFLPINFSLTLHGNQLNFNDTYMHRNLGAELLTGVNVDNFALYFGGGYIEARGLFVGADTSGVCNEDCTADPSDPALNGSTRTITHRLREAHTVIGFSVHYENLFAAAEVDRYQDAVYGIKVGVRF
jgi:hypothetical protein